MHWKKNNGTTLEPGGTLLFFNSYYKLIMTSTYVCYVNPWRQHRQFRVYPRFKHGVPLRHLPRFVAFRGLPQLFHHLGRELLRDLVHQPRRQLALGIRLRDVSQETAVVYRPYHKTCQVGNCSRNSKKNGVNKGFGRSLLQWFPNCFGKTYQKTLTLLFLFEIFICLY